MICLFLCQLDICEHNRQVAEMNKHLNKGEKVKERLVCACVTVHVAWQVMATTAGMARLIEDEDVHWLLALDLVSLLALRACMAIITEPAIFPGCFCFFLSSSSI